MSSAHEQHVRDFTERMKAIVTPENLRRQLTPRRHGVFTTRTVVGVFRQRAGVGVVWLQRCSASDDELVNHAIFVDTPEGPKIDASSARCLWYATRTFIQGGDLP